MLAAKGQVLELDDYVASWDEWEDFYPGVREDVSYDGHVMGIPYRTNYRGSVVFRPSMFERGRASPRTTRHLGGAQRACPEAHRPATATHSSRPDSTSSTIPQVYEDWPAPSRRKHLQRRPDQAVKRHSGRPNGACPARAPRVAGWLYAKGGHRFPGPPTCTPSAPAGVAIQQLWPGNVGNCETNAGAVFDDLEVAPPLQGPARPVMQLYVDKYMPWKLTRKPRCGV